MLFTPPRCRLGGLLPLCVNLSPGRGLLLDVWVVLVFGRFLVSRFLLSLLRLPADLPLSSTDEELTHVLSLAICGACAATLCYLVDVLVLILTITASTMRKNICSQRKVWTHDVACLRVPFACQLQVSPYCIHTVVNACYFKWLCGNALRRMGNSNGDAEMPCDIWVRKTLPPRVGQPNLAACTATE